MRFALRLAALAVAPLVTGANAPDALAALAAASGHAALVHVRATSTRTVEGRPVVTTFDQLGSARLRRRCVAEVCVGSWFDGSRSWGFGLNEVPMPEEPTATTFTLRTLAAIESYAFAEPSFRSSGGTVEPAGAGRWRVRAREGSELVATFDPNGALRRVESTSGRLLATYGGFARAGEAGFALMRAGPLGDEAFDRAGVVPGPIEVPRGPATAVAGEADVALGDEPVPIVPCTIAGRAVRCLLDTGAIPSAMTLGLSDALKLEPHGELEIAGAGRFATGFVEAGPLHVGPVRFEQARFAVIPPSAAARFDVVVGADLLARMRLQFRRGRGIVRIGPPGASPVANAVALSFRGGAPHVQAMLGQQGVSALFDTGDQAIASMGYAMYREGPQWPVVGRGRAFGVGGGDDVLTVRVDDARVGAVALGAVQAEVRRTQAAPHIGIGLWSRYDIDLDEAAERVGFTPR